MLGGTVPGTAAAIEQARRRPDIPIAATDHYNSNLAKQAPRFLAGSTLTQIKMVDLRKYKE
jgi:hypothetical protein